MQVAILEDVVTTGGSTLKAIARVREHGLDGAASILGLVDREEGGREALEKEAPLITLFRRQDFYDDRRRGVGRGVVHVCRAVRRVCHGGRGCAAAKQVHVDFSETPRDYRPRTTARLRALDAPRAWCWLDVATSRSRSGPPSRAGTSARPTSSTTPASTACRRPTRPRCGHAQRETCPRGLRVPHHGADANYKWNDLEKGSSAWRADAGRRPRARAGARAGQGREAARRLRERVLPGEATRSPRPTPSAS